MPLTLTLRQKTSIPLEVDAIRLETVRTLSQAEIEKLPVQYGNQRPTLAEFFTVSGSAAEDNELRWVGDCEKVKLIGQGLKDGKIVVEGSAGMHLGAEMRGGEILVEGDVSDWAGAEMHGGLIQVRGNAGHLVGAVYRGGHKGMTAGTILIHGNAGNEIGHSMRRGLIAIGGNSGDVVGYGLLAGTIIICGEMGIRNGAGMKRGSIVWLGTGTPPRMLPTFKFAASCRPGFLQLYFKLLADRGFPLPESYRQATFGRYCGDFLELGRGEILLREAA
ncbi:MAG: formylmethanofuran dehydrogenase subunit C [Planctomycetales bacterium]